MAKLLDSFLGKIGNLDIPRAIGILGSDIGKIGLESRYDDLAKMEFFQEFKRMGKLKKYSFVGGLLFLSIIIDQNMNENSPLRLALKEILKDVWPEIGKRVINGDKRPLNIELEKYDSKVEKPHEKTLLRTLCAQSAETFLGFCAWLDLSEADEQRIILQQMEAHGFTAEEIQNLPKLHQEKLRGLFAAFREQGPVPPKKSVVSEINAELRQSNTKLEARIAARKGGRSNG